MENANCGFLNSPIIQTNTPIKRLGLSRKRKSYGSERSINAKIQACEKFSECLTYSEKSLLDKQVQDTTKNTEEGDNPSINYDKEIDLLRKNIAEKKEKLKALQCNKDDVEELENLIEIWKSGCKNAFLHFSQLLKDQQSENIDLKAVMNKLGIWETMTENFEGDSEIFP